MNLTEMAKLASLEEDVQKIIKLQLFVCFLLFRKHSTIFFGNNEIYVAILLQFPRCCSLFYHKTLFSLNDCEATLKV